MSTFKRSNSNTTEEIVYSNSSKCNGRKISLKSLFSRPSLLAPVNVCSYECNNAVGTQSNNLYNRNLAEAESAPEDVMESTKSSSNLYNSPHEHAESIIQKALNEGDSVFDGYKNLFSNLKEEEPYKRYNLNGLGEKNPLFTNGVDENLNKKIKGLVQNGYKNKQEMDELWKEVNKNEKDKYDNLGKDIFGHYVKTKALYDTPPRFAEATWKTVNEIYMLTEKNTESYLKVIFYDWFNGKKTTADEFYLLLCATKLVWRTVMDNINHSCMGMLTKCFELKKTTGKELSCTMILNKYKDAFSGTTRSRHSFVTNVENQEVKNYVPTKHNYENCLKTAPYIDDAQMPGYFLKSEYDEQPVHEHLENAVTNKPHPKMHYKGENKEVKENTEQENTEVENTEEENTEQENTEVENTEEENTEEENTEQENTEVENTEEENTEEENTEQENTEVENTEEENTEEEDTEEEENKEEENTDEEENKEEENTDEEENKEEENTDEEENKEEENTDEEENKEEEEENKEEEEENTEDEDEDDLE
ncbi:Plasmodium exported protein (PHISTb), unknown function [Plasmodium sp. DRC-Itaito]|nr:Plasmodium exported protein (PHISTb), unknown function [Plasmodium sp. DRC-Itaito]